MFPTYLCGVVLKRWGSITYLGLLVLDVHVAVLERMSQYFILDFFITFLRPVINVIFEKFLNLCS